MKLRDINTGMVAQAIELYMEAAYSTEPPTLPIPVFGSDPSETVEHYLSDFETEHDPEEGTKLRRYILRLGNQSYPFMKFVIQENLIHDEFVFLVDTHDDMFNIPTSEFADLRRIREFNQEIKRQIEELWADKEIPTLSALKKIVADTSRMAGAQEHDPQFKNKTILLVDDDLVMGDTLESLLISRGFKVERLFDGVDAVKDADPLLHDLIIMDNDMKIMDGQEACRILKEDARRSSIPIMIASARNIDISLIHQADAYLVKPFHQDVLFSFIRHILKPS